MEEFLQKRELVSFSIVEGSHKIPKKDFETVKVSQKHHNKRIETVLPDGSLTQLLIEETILDTNGTLISLTRKSYQFKNNEKHGKYTLCIDWGSEKEKIRVDGNYRNGKPHGAFKRYISKQVRATCEFSNGELIECSEYFGPQSRTCQTIFCTERNATQHVITKINMGDGSTCIEEQIYPSEGPCRERLRFFFLEKEARETDEETEYSEMRERDISCRVLDDDILYGDVSSQE